MDKESFIKKKVTTELKKAPTPVITNLDWKEYPLLITNLHTKQVQFKYRLEAPGSISISLFNDKKHEIIQQDFLNQKSGAFLQSIDMSSLPLGNYLLIITGEREVINKYRVTKK